MKHGESLTHRPAGPTATGPQERRADLLPPDLPPGAVHYESTDVAPRPIVKALSWLVALTALVVALLYPVFLGFRGGLQRKDPAPPPMGRHEPGRLPAEPRLQTTPARDLAALQVDDQDLLKNYGWVDEQKGIVHVPIEVAMSMVAERGLPSTAPLPAGSPGAAASPAPPGTVVPSPAATPEARR